MSALPRPKVADGPLRALSDELHRLHHEAGWPSLRTMARAVGSSHTTVSAAFTEPKAPRWGLLELIVEVLGGDTEKFHRLWLDATSLDGQPVARAPVPDHHRGDGLPPRDLPADVAGFSGREEQLAGLNRLLDPNDDSSSVAVCVISGTAGVGKTALAVHWAHRVSHLFPDGQLYLDMRGYDPDRPLDPSQALGTFLRELGLADAEVPIALVERAAKFRTLVAERKVLILLDNVRSASQVIDLMPGTSSCFTVVTSRDTLPSLIIRNGAVRVNLNALSHAESMILLRRMIGDRVSAEPQPAARLAELCVQLPLALRIVAEQAVAHPHVSLAELAADLDDQGRRLDLLAAGDDGWTSVRSVFSWSLTSLRHETAAVFELLGLHPGPDIDVDAVAALAGIDRPAAQRALQKLSQAHLVEDRSATAGATPRRRKFGMHDLLRLYAVERSRRLTDEVRGEATTRLFDHYATWAWSAMDVAYPESHHHRRALPNPPRNLDVFAEPDAAWAWLDSERENLLASASVAAEHVPHHTARLAAALPDYLDARARFEDALELQRAATVAARSIGDVAGEAAALDAIGHIFRRTGRYRDALDHHRRAAEIFDQLGDEVGAARAAHGVGIVSWRLGHYDDSLQSFGRALDVYRRTGDRVGEGNVLHGLGVANRRLGRLPDAIDFYRRSIAVHQETGDRAGECRATNNLGIIYLQLGRYAEALELYQRNLATNHELGDRVGQAIALNNMGHALEYLGEYDASVESHQAALEIYHQTGYRVGIADGSRGLGTVYARLGRHDEAVDQLQHALVVSRELEEASLQASVLNDLGSVLDQAGHTDRAQECFAAAGKIAADTGDRYEHARALDGAGRLLLGVGDIAGACDFLRQAAEMFAELGLPDADRIHDQLQEQPCLWSKQR